MPGVRELETEQRAVAREVPGVRELETEQRAAAREVPGVRELLGGDYETRVTEFERFDARSPNSTYLG